jgi:hypothetical protein
MVSFLIGPQSLLLNHVDIAMGIVSACQQPPRDISDAPEEAFAPRIIVLMNEVQGPGDIHRFMSHRDTIGR